MKLQKKVPVRPTFFFMLSLVALALLSAFLKLPLYLIGVALTVCICARYTNVMLSLLLSIASSFFAGSGIMYVLNSVDYEILFFMAVVGSLTASVLRSIGESYNPPSILFGTAMVMWLFDSFHYQVPPLNIAIALIFALSAGYTAHRMSVIDTSGVLSGTLIGVLIIIFTDVKWFLLLLSFLVLGGIFTKYKYEFKRTLGIAQRTRGYKNVFGNALCALAMAIAFRFHPVFSVGFLGAVATATSDTLATEIGETYKKEPLLITTLERVPAGTSGAISLLGEISALLSSALIALLAILLGFNMFSMRVILIATVVGGFLGTHVDSLLGATLERRKILDNHMVNLLSTVFGALVSMGVYFMVS
mgnify:CR=1 FL=1